MYLMMQNKIQTRYISVLLLIYLEYSIFDQALTLLLIVAWNVCVAPQFVCVVTGGGPARATRARGSEC